MSGMSTGMLGNDDEARVDNEEDGEERERDDARDEMPGEERVRLSR